MNFFGHAVVAAWQDASPGFVLGAMLPDFCSMARARIPRVDHHAIASGIALHHETDAIFHQAPTFLRVCAQSVRELTELGVDRGTARAVAHVGTELLLDGLLLEGGEPTEAYVEAVRAARPEWLGRHIRFGRLEHAERFDCVRRRLQEWGIPDGYADPGFVAERVLGALRTRPRLRPSEPDAERVRRWIPAARRRVVELGSALVSEVRAGLSLPAPAAPHLGAPSTSG